MESQVNIKVLQPVGYGLAQGKGGSQCWPQFCIIACVCLACCPSPLAIFLRVPLI